MIHQGNLLKNTVVIHIFANYILSKTIYINGNLNKGSKLSIFVEAFVEKCHIFVNNHHLINFV